MQTTARCRPLHDLLCVFALCAAPSASATEAAHVHGVMKIDIALDKQVLTVQLDSPLDSLLGFEHRPKSPAQRLAADALLKRMSDGAALFRPTSAAQCALTATTVASAVLQSGVPIDPPASAPHSALASAPHDGERGEHADIEASYAFRCVHPDALTTVEVGLFDAFKRLQKIEVQVAGPKGQSKQTLKRPQKSIRLVPR